MHALVKFFARDQRGTSAMEYALLAGFVVVALAAIGPSFGVNVTSLFAGMWTKMNAASSAS